MQVLQNYRVKHNYLFAHQLVRNNIKRGKSSTWKPFPKMQIYHGHTPTSRTHQDHILREGWTGDQETSYPNALYRPPLRGTSFESIQQ